MRVLIACEFSGIVREAFRKRGHDAWSCDLLPAEDESIYHYRDDVLTHSQHGWDMMIAFPPCTHLAVSGARWFKEKRAAQLMALEFVQMLMDAPIPHIAIENPIGVISTKIRKPDQIIQPWQFGEDASKKTCLWLKNLPLLKPAKLVLPHYRCRCGYSFGYELGKYGCANCCADYGPAKLVHSNQTPTGQNNEPPGPDQARNRSRTYQGIADAMAEQWG